MPQLYRFIYCLLFFTSQINVRNCYKTENPNGSILVNININDTNVNNISNNNHGSLVTTQSTITQSLINTLEKSIEHKFAQQKKSEPKLSTQFKTKTQITDNKPLYQRPLEFVDDLLRNNIGNVFMDNRIKNYSHFIALPDSSSVFVVGNDVTLLKLNISSLSLIDSFTLPQQTRSSTGCNNSNCRQSKSISLLAKMPNNQMIWFCFVQLTQYDSGANVLTDNGCMVPNLNNLAEPLLQWENPHFTAFQPIQSANILNAADGFTYIVTFELNYLRIFRANMPNWDGHIDWNGALVTGKSSLFIAEPAQIILTFETKDETYFVLREQSVNCRRSSKNPDLNRIPNDPNNSNNVITCQTDVAKLIRICKGDPGGVPHVSAGQFATFAKSDLLCASTDEDGGYFVYTHISSAYWDNTTQRLYALFTTEKSAPVGSALCVYSIHDLTESFTGPFLRTPNSMRSSSNNKSPLFYNNSFPNICTRLNSKNCTAEEISLARRISIRFPYRFIPVRPEHKHALLSQTGVHWSHVEAYQLPNVVKLNNANQINKQLKTTIIWIATQKQLSQFVLYEHYQTGQNSDHNRPVILQPIICKLNEISLGSELEMLNQMPNSVDTFNELDKFHYYHHQQQQQNRVRNKFNQIGLVNLHTTNENGQTIKLHNMEQESDELIKQISIVASRLYIITNQKVIALPLARCANYRTYNQCIDSRDPHCGWNWPKGQCTLNYQFEPVIKPDPSSTITPTVDYEKLDGSHCPGRRYFKHLDDNTWTPWYTCRWVNTSLTMMTRNARNSVDNLKQGVDSDVSIEGADTVGAENDEEFVEYDADDVQNEGAYDSPSSMQDADSVSQPETVGTCLCRICLSQTKCIFGSQQVINCTKLSESWLAWSTWSECDTTKHIETRHRRCRIGAVCEGANINYRPCTVSDYSGVSSLLQKSNFLNDGFTVIHLLLVAICGLLIGSLITIVVSFTCKRQHTIHVCGSKTYLDKDPLRCYHLRAESQNTCLIEEPSSATTWITNNEKDSSWCHKSGMESRFPLLSHTSQTAAPFCIRNPTGRKSIRPRQSNRSYDHSIFQLPTSTPLPSPLSILSCPSTASTILKDKFTFDSFSDHNHSMQGDCDGENSMDISEQDNQDNQRNNKSMYLCKLITGVTDLPNETILNLRIPKKKKQSNMMKTKSLSSLGDTPNTTVAQTLHSTYVEPDQNV